MTINDAFHTFARKSSDALGTPYGFAIAVLLLVIWGATGPFFDFSDTWQLIVNTATTIVTFIMVFLIQNTQNRDARAIHLKLDELLKTQQGARNSLVDLEDMSDEELNSLQHEFERARKKKDVNHAEREKAGKEKNLPGSSPQR
ncbi:low affinity iron permease family protein [Pelotalea chapellei]|uniref:Low affinity iron permease family protein n=1 Tax=Pelotalea chapellei TaxID=44671 RepID=A0ABS5UCJ6_9BACT|nr:low affinity iron permease family protein [Pelotalea chapellei]MBT1073406.1 low affinity iron permease family protein [Pelotalea chapellei]